MFRKTLLGVAILVAGSAFQHSALAEPLQVRVLNEWSGSVENESLQSIAPPAITTSEGFGILWKAWQGRGEVPKVDFRHSLVIASTTRGSQLKASFNLTDKGDLKPIGVATRDLRPGFRYILTEIAREGVASIDGKPLVIDRPENKFEILPTGIPYQPGKKLTGSLHFDGSVTMSHMLSLWANDFGRFHEKLEFQFDNEGSESGLEHLKEDGAAIVALSRPITRKEIATWEKELNKKVLSFRAFEDDIAIIVHPSNPVKQLSTQQLRMILAPGNEPLTWGKVGLTKDWAEKPITLHGRDEKSGTRHYLKRLAVGANGEERPAKEYPSDHQIVEAVAADPGAIGYCRSVSVRKSVSPIMIGSSTTSEASPSIRRRCRLVIAVPEGEAIPALVKEFLVYVYRLEGQSLLFRDGFTPLDKEAIAEELKRLGIEDLK